MRIYRYLSLAAAIGLSTSWLTVSAEEEERMFLVVELADGRTESVMLTNDAEGSHPTLFHKEGILSINNYQLSISEVEGMRLEKRMVDEIEVIDDLPIDDLRIDDLPIYDLSGRKLSTFRSQLSTLKKGVYIVNGKKIIVK